MKIQFEVKGDYDNKFFEQVTTLNKISKCLKIINSDYTVSRIYSYRKYKGKNIEMVFNRREE